MMPDPGLSPVWYILHYIFMLRTSISYLRMHGLCCLTKLDCQKWLAFYLLCKEIRHYLSLLLLFTIESCWVISIETQSKCIIRFSFLQQKEILPEKKMLLHFLKTFYVEILSNLHNYCKEKELSYSPRFSILLHLTSSLPFYLSLLNYLRISCTRHALYHSKVSNHKA